MSTNWCSIKPLKLKLLAGEQEASEVSSVAPLGREVYPPWAFVLVVPDVCSIWRPWAFIVGKETGRPVIFRFFFFLLFFVSSDLFFSVPQF